MTVVVNAVIVNKLFIGLITRDYYRIRQKKNVLPRYK